MTYWPNDRGSSYPTNAMEGAPPAAQWFPAAFEQLVRNAHQPLA